MTNSLYRERWKSIRENQCPIEELTRLAKQIAYSFLDTYLKDYHYEEDYINLLCEMTTFSKDPRYNLPAAQALFGIIIESLCDDFEELQTITYNKVMSQVISYCRHVPAGKLLDEKLKEFGINDCPQLVKRIQDIREKDKQLSPNQQIKKIILLSRVTIGADVAITSILIQRLKMVFPSAEMVLIGKDKLEQIYGANQEIILRYVPYTRNGDLIERLSSWYNVLDIIQEEINDCSYQDTILIDPDSRLSQLGVLPLFPEEQYFFFDSRSDKIFMNKLSMPELVNTWLSQLLAKDDFYYPRVWLPSTYLDYAGKLTQQLYLSGAKRIVVLNFGYGGNPRKRVGSEFEIQMALTLLQEPYTILIVDRGFGQEESANTDLLLQEIKKHGYATEDRIFGQKSLACSINWGAIGIKTQIGEIASLIACSDEFIGYDSACQHIAAALEVPCITIFAGSNNMRFIRRWSAFGKNWSQIVHVDNLNHPLDFHVQDIVTRVMHQRQPLLNHKTITGGKR